MYFIRQYFQYARGSLGNGYYRFSIVRCVAIDHLDGTFGAPPSPNPWPAFYYCLLMNFSATAAIGQRVTARTVHGDRAVTGQSILYGSLFKLAKGTSSTVHLPKFIRKTLCIYAILLVVVMITES